MKAVKVTYETALVKKEIEFTGKAAESKALAFARKLRNQRHKDRRKYYHIHEVKPIYLKITFEQYEKEPTKRSVKKKIVDTIKSFLL